MNYTSKPSSRITQSIGENRMKIRLVDFEFSAFRQTDRQTDASEGLCFIYIDNQITFILLIGGAPVESNKVKV